MAVYTVHEPPPRKGETAAAPERFMFVRDGFYFWAFLLTPLWLLVHRLWLVLVLYVGLSILVGVGMHFAGVPTDARGVVYLLIGLLIGFEAASLRRWTLARRRWKALGVVVGDDLESAEARFFSTWVARKSAEPVPLPPAPPSPPASSPVPQVAASGSPDVIGWMPDTGTTR